MGVGFLIGRFYFGLFRFMAKLQVVPTLHDPPPGFHVINTCTDLIYFLESGDRDAYVIAK